MAGSEAGSEQERSMSVPVSVILGRKGQEVVTVSPHTTLTEVARTLTAERVGALVVTDPDGAVSGMISERDIVRAVAEDGPTALDRPVEKVMTQAVTTCTPTTTVTELAAMMTEGRVRHLPVLDQGRLAGIVSIGDVVKSRIDELATQAESLERYVTGTAY
jgi:CBS domain-containing protein